MEIPSEVMIHNAQMNLKGSRGRLLEIADGYYEVNLEFGDNLHRVLLPVSDTVVISQEPEEKSTLVEDVER